MSFVSITRELLNETLTENGDKAYVTSFSSCLDYFSLVGGKRYDPKGAALLFTKAYYEDAVKASQLLFYTRDPRGGVGERRLFRFLFAGLCASYPEKARKLLPFVPKYGRYDDLLCALNTPVESDVLDLIQAQLDEDLKNKEAGKPISLLAKWLPSINTSSVEARQLALHLASRLGLSKADYRKTLSYLRKGLIVENSLRTKEYDFDYATVPSLAMAKYRQAFARNDEERFSAYLGQVNKGEAKMHVEVLDVVTLIRRVKKENEAEKLAYFESTWQALLKEGAIDKRSLVVRDGSGSMYSGYYRGENAPIEIADALTLLTSARLTGEFKDKFITFSDNPQYVDLSAFKSLKDKVDVLDGYNDIGSTDIQKVYELILNVYASKDFKPEDALDQVVIISDMEFNQAVVTDGDYHGDNAKLKSTFEYFDEAFKKLGYSRPEVVFWNVASRNTHVPVTKNEIGVKMISGSNKNLIDLVCSMKSVDPEDFMNKALARYNDIAEALKEE